MTGETCPLPPEAELEGGQGSGGGGGAGGEAGAGELATLCQLQVPIHQDHCFQCGLPGHTQDKCTHVEATKHKKSGQFDATSLPFLLCPRACEISVQEVHKAQGGPEEGSPSGVCWG